MSLNLENIIILCPISDSFWGEIDSDKNTFSQLHRLHRGHRIRRNTVHIVKGSLLSDCLPSTPSISRNENYLVLFTDDLLAYKPAENSGFFFIRGDHNKDFEFKVRWVAEKFKRISHELLVEDLLDTATDTVALLERLTRFCGCEHYSLWLYNPHTNHFTLSSASFSSEATHISKDDPRFTLKDALESDKVFSAGTLKVGLVNSAPLQGMASINRFTLKVTTSQVKRDILGGGIESDFLCVASFYSSQKDLVFGDRIRKLFESFLRAEIANEISGYGTYYSALVHDLADNYEPGKLPEFFKAFTLKITSVLGYESASIFLDDGTNSQLELKAIAEFKSISPRGEIVMNNSIPAANPVVYPLDRPSKTVDVYRNNKVGYSYDITRDKSNSGIFSEKTKHAGENWIGVPIARSGTRVLGVLRVKNKCVEDKVVPFNSADVDILKNLASIVAYLTDVEREYLMRQKEAIQQIEKKELEYEELSEFLKTYRHEIKSPLVVVTAASQLLEIAMAKDQLIVKGAVPRKVREVLDDLDMVGNRLSFIANILTFDARELVKELRPCKLFTEIVTPVLAFLRLYAKKRGKDIIVDKDSLLAANVICDPIAASMVFNILLDNAIKYSPKGGVIRVAGVLNYMEAGVVVESRGLPIHLDETEKIFLKYFRGVAAMEQKTEGSGIGLFLASEIMRLNHGSIQLKHRDSPTAFEMRLPLYH